MLLWFEEVYYDDGDLVTKRVMMTMVMTIVLVTGIIIMTTL